MLQSTHRLILAGLIAFFVAAGVALTVVILVTRYSNGSQDSKAAAEAYCCTIDAMTCAPFTSACGSNEASCIACDGTWVSTESMIFPEDSSNNIDSPAANPPVAPSPSSQVPGGSSPTPLDSTSTEQSGGSSSSSYNTVTTTARPTIAFTIAPTTLQPTFADPGQACLTAQNDARAVTAPLDMPATATEPVLLARSALNQLCTLVQVDNARSRFVPVGRSYEGHRWEPYASELVGPVATLACDPNVCSVVLPPLPAGYSYELVAFAHSVPVVDEMARFLEQTTFGPTRQALNDLLGNDDDTAAPLGMATWIKEQQEVVPATLHREFYRQRLNARAEYPASMGLPTQPCDAGVRYRRFAFTELDFFKDMEIKTDDTSKRKVLYLDGQARTVLETKVLTVRRGQTVQELEDGTYRICEVSPGLNTGFGVSVAGMGCLKMEINGERMGNPAIFFDNQTPPTHPPVTLDGFGFELSSMEDFFSTTKIIDPNCDLVPPQRGGNVYAMIGILNGEHWIFDPRHDFRRNTLRDPLRDGGGDWYRQTRLEDDEVENQNARRNEVACANPRMNFLNENFCQLSYSDNVCSSRDPPDVFVDLVEDTFEKIYLATEGLSSRKTRYVYAIEGLKQQAGNVPYATPCTPGEMSRWIPVDDCSAAFELSTPQSNEIFTDLLRAAEDENQFLRDIVFPATGISCNPNDFNRYGFKVEVDGQCWLNVHRMHLQVFDFSSFVDQHPGGKAQIQQFANATRSDKFRIKFPDWHPIDRFYGWTEEFRTEVGRYGDSIRFSELPSSLHIEEVATKLGAIASFRNSGPAVVCGSPGEIANRIRNTGERHKGAYEAVSNARVSGKRSPEQRLEIWLALALSSEDQLRQRVAWALSQILVISPGGVGPAIIPETESWLAFYDIFVRNAFGNYRDILREVSYSPMMATMLTMLDNKSTDYLWRSRNRVEFADENYAREIMQLFSVGLVKLNNDGTVRRGENRESSLTYTNSEITEYARVWTGFRKAPPRGNIEAYFGANNIDPMQILPEWRDSFPKLGLDQTYVGDGLPLCSDLPERHFLRKGATYVLLGSNPTPQYHEEPADWASNTSVIRPRLDSDNSKLYERLCRLDGKRCSYPSKVVLPETLECFGVECDVQSLRTVEVGPGIYYEYLRPPCAYQAFFSDGRVLKKQWFDAYSCGDPRQQTGGVGCCEAGSTRGAFNPTFDHFSGERVTFNEAEAFCADAGLELCERPQVLCEIPCDKFLEYWSSSSCTVQAKIGLDGSVAIVHNVPSEQDLVLKQIREYTKSFFRVVWEESLDALLSDYEDMCDSLGCGRDSSDNLCLCPVDVEEAIVFKSTPSRAQLLNQLHIGAFPPDLQSETLQSVTVDDRIIMYSKDGSYSADSIFEFRDDNGIRRYRKNLRSDALIGSPGGLRLKFRNPPHMISIHDPTVLEMHQETEAALDHYFYHQNTAPFLAIRLSQRFGLSNPSPRYVAAAATAFRLGRYIDQATGIRYGTGEYGNMAAMTAALLLDREARSVVLDADPVHGSLFEPFLRFVRVMKSLEFRAKADRVFVDVVDQMLDLIGEEPHNLPDVFSFFLPEFQPQGPVGNSGLVSPESEVLTAPAAVNLMNGLLSLLKYGLDSAFGGFGNGRGGLEKDRVLGRSNFADGDNRYRPTNGLDSSGVIDELATLLTSGRLSQEKRDLLKTVYEGYRGSEAYINVQQLIATSPEFNANGLSRGTGQDRKTPEQTPSSASQFKAVVEIYLPGGWDSFNILVPHECATTNAAGEPVDAQYRSVRGELAMTPQEAKYHISVDPADGQPCSKFAIHQDLPIVKELFDDGDLLFFSNTGVVNTAAMTKTNYQEVTISKIFAHNAMYHEINVLDPFRDDPGTGVFGRMCEVLTARGYGAQGMSIDDPAAAMTPDSTAGARPPLVVSRYGATKFNDRPEQEEDFPLEEYSSSLNSATDLYSNVFGETWSAEYLTAITQSNFLTDALSNTTVGEVWSTRAAANKLGSQLSMVARLLQTRDTRSADRDMYFMKAGFWDHHASMKLALSNELQALESPLRAFVTELKSQGLWDDVAVVITSDFGRTLTMNGQEGSDHAWGGHYVLLGGSVRGRRILGEYPSDLTDNGPLSIGRGRYIPTTSWDSVFHGIAKWMGVETQEEMNEVLPNLHQTYGPGFTSPFEASDLFLTT